MNEFFKKYLKRLSNFSGWRENPILLSQTIGGISYVGCFAPNWLLGRKEWHCELEIMQNILYRRTLYRCASLNSKRKQLDITASSFICFWIFFVNAVPIILAGLFLFKYLRRLQKENVYKCKSYFTFYENTNSQYGKQHD